MTSNIPSIHETFNARSLSTEELCRSFIISNHYYKLAGASNTIMIGPRGSGKTTLMRMLQAQSLEVWQHAKANEFRNNINFSGVFIPTDRVWKTQYEKIRESFCDPEQLDILQATFTYHVLEKFVSTVEYLTSRTEGKANGFRTVSITKSVEAELVIELSSLWKVKPRIDSLKSLEIAITNKKSEISTYLSKVLTGNSSSMSKPETIVGSIESILGDSVRIANIYFDDREYRWAFLFDELELAPENIVQPLVNSMRGGPDNILFKLSLSPYHKDVSITSLPESSMKDQDLDFITLTGTPDMAGYEFSKELCSNIFNKHGLAEKSIDEYFEQPVKMDELKEFLELSEKDSSFTKYLESQRIDLNNFNQYRENDKRTIIRKVKFVVQLRNYYRKKNAKIGRRTPPDVYAGFKNICKSMEYNPRMLIGIMNKFIPHAQKDGVVPIHKQLICLGEISDSFKALLNTIAIDTNIGDVNTIYDLVEKIALFFQAEISGEVFKPEPKGTVSFSKNENERFVAAIGFALNAGALVAESGILVDSHDVVDIRKTRCRLSHMFSHKFGLLLSSPRAIGLSEIIFPAGTSKLKKSGMDDLFNN